MGKQLDDTTYFAVNNGYLTSSKLKSYMQDPYFFYRRHILGDLPFEKTPSMKIGSAVDCWLTESRAAFIGKYEQKVLKSEDKLVYESQKTMDDEYLLTETEMSKVHAICEACERTSLWQEIKADKAWVFQAILRLDKKGGMGKFFKGVSGKPDAYKISEDCTKATIIDIKTANDINPRRFAYICADYGYYFQQAYYQSLLQAINPKIKEVTSYLLALETDSYLNRVAFFKLNQTTIDIEKVNIARLLSEISQITEFKPTDTTWDDLVEI